MSKLIKKYAFISTSYFEGGEWKNFHVLKQSLTHEDIIRIKSNASKYIQLWAECYEQERENAKKHISVDLRTDLEKFLNERNVENNYISIADDYKLWSEKDLIIECFDFETSNDEKTNR